MVIRDVGSKFGTFVNNLKMELGSDLDLTENDILKFGQSPLFTVEYAPLVFCASTLDNASKIAAASMIKTLGGRLEKSYTNKLCG